GGYRVQGRKVDQARALVDDAVALAEAGAFSLVLEGIPESVGRKVSESVSIRPIATGAGRYCDGQGLAFHDSVGRAEPAPPKFVRRYARIGDEISSAVHRFVQDVRVGAFPSEAEVYSSPAMVPTRDVGR